MRTAALLLTSALLLAGCVKPKDPTEEIQAQYDRYSEAYVKNDVDTLLSILTDDFVLTDGEGVIHSRADYRKELEERKEQGIKAASYKVQIENVVREGDAASVITREYSSSITEESVVHQYRDVWVLQDGEWKLKSSTTILHGG